MKQRSGFVYTFINYMTKFLKLLDFIVSLIRRDNLQMK
jgi:hypothetical protein